MKLRHKLTLPTLLLPFTLLTRLPQATAEEVIIEIYPTQTFQRMLGFGAALSESSAWLLQNELSYPQRTNLLAELFDPIQGVGFTLVRHPMGSSDFRLEDYTYDDMPPGETDFALTNFNVSRDELWIIPTLQEIVSINPRVAIVGSPWSPPAWMKTSTNLFQGRLRTDCYDTLAQYFLKYVQAYSNHSLHIHALTLQNEPLFEPGDYPGMYLSATAAVRLASLVGSLFQSNAVDTELWIYDHNWDNYDYPVDVLNAPETRAYVSGSAFHGYAGDVLAQTLIHDQHPDKEVHFTELSAGAWSGGFAPILEYDALNLLIGVTRNWGSSILKWNLLLDQNHGPKIAGGCADCTGVLTLDTASGEITRNADYYTLGHIAKFVRPGAYRIGLQESSPSPCATAFRNPDSNLVLIAYNDSETTRNFVIRWDGQSLTYPLPPDTLATFHWPPTPGATVDVWLTSADQTYLLQQTSDRPVFAPRQLYWAGWTWNVEDSYGEPGGNYWNAANLRLDSSNRLHLQITARDGLWYAAGLNSATSPGFGRYRWHLETNPDQLDTNLVATFRTAFDAAHELDVHIGRAFETPQTNIRFAIQPAYQSGHLAEFAASFTSELVTVEFAWTPRRVHYRIWYGHSSDPPDSTAVLADWTYEGDDVPGDTDEWVNISLWPYNAQPPGATQELILADFNFTPLVGNILFDDFEDGILSTSLWKRFNDSTSEVTETGGVLEIQPADADDAVTGCNSVRPIHWNDDGLSYSFAAVLSTLTVARSSTAGDPDIYAIQGIASGWGPQGSLDEATNAAYLRAGYDQSADTLLLEFITKTNAAGTVGNIRFAAVISNAAAQLNGGCELVFVLTYYDYQVEALSGGDPVVWSVVSGSPTGSHNLGATLYECGYQLAGANNQDGRGSVRWEECRVWSESRLPSTAGVEADGEPQERQVQVGTVDPSFNWPSPLDSRYPKHRTMVLYHADDVGRAGTITQIYIYVFSPPACPLQNYVIRAQETATNALPDHFINDRWQQIYSGTISVPSNFSGWLAVPLDTPLSVSGESNLLLDFSFDQTDYDSTILPAVAYSETHYTSVRTASGSRGTPETWSTWPTGRKFGYSGNRIVTLRLEFDSAEVLLAGNLSFEDGPPGFLTNVPCWYPVGSEYAGAIKVSPTLHLKQSLKLWKSGSGDGTQKLVQSIPADPAKEYLLSGYIMSESGEPFGGAQTYAALALEWYDSSGQLIGYAESAHYLPDIQYDLWLKYQVSSVPPLNVVSGRITCLLSSSPSQYGSVYFDKLSLSWQDAVPSTTGVPQAHTTYVYDAFDDTQMSNIWTRIGDWDSATFTESNGQFWVTPGTSYYQTSAYATTNPISWNDTSAWYVFCATLSTIALSHTKDGYDGETILGICSERDNPWWVTNSCGLYGYYDQEADLITFRFYTKTDSPASMGTERFAGTIHNLSAYLNATNQLRIGIALGENQYELSFLDQSSEPVPIEVGLGNLRAPHYLADRLYQAHWVVGAQSDLYNRPTVAWDQARVFHTRAPTVSWVGYAQISTNGDGLVAVTTRVTDANGDVCGLYLEFSTNQVSWHPAAIASVTGSLPVSRAQRTSVMQLAGISCTSETGYLQPNTIRAIWDTRASLTGVDLSGRTVTDLAFRVHSFDGYVSSITLTAFPLVVDNQGPDTQAAWASLEGNAEYTFCPVLEAAWGGFTDAASGIARYFCATQHSFASPGGQWSTNCSLTITSSASDQLTFLYVWAVDGYGNPSAAVQDHIVVLSSNGDYDADGLDNRTETNLNCNPTRADSDGDDMSDGWEYSYALDPTDASDGDPDADGDGYDNRSEFYTDTDPHDGTVHLLFRLHHPAVTLVILKWNSSTGRVYTLLSRPDSGSAWNAVAGWQSVPGTGGEMTFTADTWNIHRQYYRLKVGLPPPP